MAYFKRAILTPIRTKIRKKEQKSIDAVTKIKTKSDMKKNHPGTPCIGNVIQ